MPPLPKIAYAAAISTTETPSVSEPRLIGEIALSVNTLPPITVLLVILEKPSRFVRWSKTFEKPTCSQTFAAMVLQETCIGQSIVTIITAVLFLIPTMFRIPEPEPMVTVCWFILAVTTE